MVGHRRRGGRHAPGGAHHPWIPGRSGSATCARSAISRVGVAPISGVQLDPDHEVDVYRRANGAIGLVVATRDENGWAARLLTEATLADPRSVLLYTRESGGPQQMPSIAFGRAERGVVEVRSGGSAGERANVVGGTWIMPLPRLADPADLDWEFVLVDGTVITPAGEPPG